MSAPHNNDNQNIEECVRASLESYFSDLGGETPSNMYDMLLRLVEKPLLDVVMQQSDNNSHSGWHYIHRLGHILWLHQSDFYINP